MPNPRILIIGDEPTVRLLLRQAAEQFLCTIIAVGTAEITTVCDTLRPDAILFDLVDDSDAVACRCLREHLPHCPLIIVTDPAALAMTQASLPSEACHYLVKPVALDRLTPLLEHALATVVPSANANANAHLRRLVASLQQTANGDLYARVIQAVDRVVLAVVMEQTHGNQLRASELLGIDRKTLRHKLRTLGLAADRTNGIAVLDSVSTSS